MPSNSDVMLSVTLNKTTMPWSLHVDESNHPNYLSPGPNAQFIVWTLMGEAASGSFLPLQGSELGFAWAGAPSQHPHSGIFDVPFLSANNQLKILDHHTGPGSAGTWTYTLRANIGGTVYVSLALSAAAQNSNPRIKNN
jgi:hypothetical protein